MQRPAVFIAALLAAGCGNPTDPAPGFETIGRSEAGIHAVVEATLIQTLTVKGRCSAPHYVNCPDTTRLDEPFTVSLVPENISYAAQPSVPGAYTYVSALGITTSRDIAVRIGNAECLLSLSAAGPTPSLFLVAGNAKPVPPSETRPYPWVDVMQEMMGGIESGISVRGPAGCDPAGFDAHLMSVLIGELLPRLQAICKPVGEPYSPCPTPQR